MHHSYWLPPGRYLQASRRSGLAHHESPLQPVQTTNALRPKAVASVGGANDSQLAGLGGGRLGRLENRPLTAKTDLRERIAAAMQVASVKGLESTFEVAVRIGSLHAPTHRRVQVENPTRAISAWQSVLCFCAMNFCKNSLLKKAGAFGPGLSRENVEV
jgi:hypothetical protein